ncbi:MAG: hypothetical protein ABFD76_03485 [Smithella sp.]
MEKIFSLLFQPAYSLHQRGIMTRENAAPRNSRRKKILIAMMQGLIDAMVKRRTTNRVAEESFAQSMINYFSNRKRNIQKEKFLVKEIISTTTEISHARITRSGNFKSSAAEENIRQSNIGNRGLRR